MAHRTPLLLTDVYDPEALAVRFWARVSKGDGCWLWTGHISTNGYAQIWVMYDGRGHTIPASRVAYLLEHGALDRELLVCHTCDNPPCVRPSHLWQGTTAQNIEDCARKGRRAPHAGEGHWRAVMTAVTVEAARARYAAGGVTQKRLAFEAGVSKEVMHHALHGHTYPRGGS